MVAELELTTKEKIEILEATIEELSTKVIELVEEKTELAAKVEKLVTEREEFSETEKKIVAENEELLQDAQESRSSFTLLQFAVSGLIFIYGMMYGSYLCPK